MRKCTSIPGLICLSFFFILFSSCRKELVLFTVKEKQPYLDQLVYKDAETSVEINYKYDADNVLTGYNRIILPVNGNGSSEVALFKRDKDGMITEISQTRRDTLFDIPTLASVQYRFLYNEKKQIIYKAGTINVSAGNENLISLDSVIYTYDTKISKFDQYAALFTDVYEHIGYGTINYDANGNKSLVKLYQYADLEPQLINEISFEYDENPKSIFSKDDALALEILNSFDLIDFTSSFNIVKFNIVDKQDPTNNEEYAISYSYATDHKKPLSAKVKLNSVEIGTLKFNYSIR